MKTYYSLKELFDNLKIDPSNLDQYQIAGNIPIFKKISPVRSFLLDLNEEYIKENVFNFLTSKYSSKEDFVNNHTAKHETLSIAFKNKEDVTDKRFNNINVFDLLFLIRPELVKKWTEQLFNEIKEIKNFLDDEKIVALKDCLHMAQTNNKSIPVFHQITYNKLLNKKLFTYLYENIDTYFSIDFFNLTKLCGNKDEYFNRNIKHILKNNINFENEQYKKVFNKTNVFNIVSENMDEKVISILDSLNLLMDEKPIRVESDGKIKKMQDSNLSINLNENLFIKTGKSIKALEDKGIMIRFDIMNRIATMVKERVSTLSNAINDTHNHIDLEKALIRLANIEKIVLNESMKEPKLVNNIIKKRL